MILSVGLLSIRALFRPPKESSIACLGLPIVSKTRPTLCGAGGSELVPTLNKRPLHGKVMNRMAMVTPNTLQKATSNVFHLQSAHKLRRPKPHLLLLNTT